MKPAEQQSPVEAEGPARVTGMHRRDRDIFDENANLIIGKKGTRRIDGLAWLNDHGTIARHQFLAGRRLQEDWQLSKIEAGSRSGGCGGGGSSPGTLSDAKLDAGQRVRDAMASMPVELETLLSLFLCPEDHPFSLERIAVVVRRDKRAVSFGIQMGLTMLARHYGYGG